MISMKNLWLIWALWGTPTFVERTSFDQSEGWLMPSSVLQTGRRWRGFQWIPQLVVWGSKRNSLMYATLILAYNTTPGNRIFQEKWIPQLGCCIGHKCNCPIPCFFLRSVPLVFNLSCKISQKNTLCLFWHELFQSHLKAARIGMCPLKRLYVLDEKKLEPQIKPIDLFLHIVALKSKDAGVAWTGDKLLQKVAGGREYASSLYLLLQQLWPSYY